ncbi:MAG TPA: SGNH/GDSL hydrolase family protein [Pyrinomonadaceae bacterium]|nr:SGNH/GDSL hydrolase family protein [Pyrinomonadaceae bacterium]
MPESEIGGPRPAVKLLVVACGVAAGLLIFEVFLRAAGYTYPVFYEPDEARGWALRPGVEGWYRKEGAAYVRINSEGLRDGEHASEKRPGVLRVALLGDSYAEALQVAQEDAFWSVAEEQLRSSCGALGGREVEFINFGVSGYGTAQELFTLREKVWAYAPDAVLLAVTTNNDLIDNTRALKGTDEIPYFVLRDGRLTLDDSFRRDPAFRWRQSLPSRAGRWLRERLRFVQAIHQGHAAVKSALAARRERAAQASKAEPAAAQGGAEPPSPTPAEPGVANMIYDEPSEEVWRGAWRVTEALVAEMHREVSSRGARFLVVTLSNPIQAHPDAAAREAFARRLGVPDLFYPERRFQALGEREGFPVFNLAPYLQLYAEQHKVFLHGFGRDLGNGHWNETGHRAAGQLLAQKLCEALAH